MKVGEACTEKVQVKLVVAVLIGVGILVLVEVLVKNGMSLYTCIVVVGVVSGVVGWEGVEQVWVDFERWK